jgi:uncharacterized ion transporter superfamily protein YfcC
MEESSLKVGKGAFLLSAGIILALMILSGVLTRVLPAGVFERIEEGGRTLVVSGSYREIPRPDYPFWRWFTAPVEILFGPESLTPIVLCAFILIVGGAIAVLEQAGVMEALIGLLVARFRKHRYLLIAVLIFFFMFLAGFVAIYEAMIPMVIFMVPIAISLGWDSLTGLGLSLLPLGFGLAAGVTNPFTVGVAQQIADLPLFSGFPLRLAFFLTVYGLLCFFVIRHAKRVEADPARSLSYADDEPLRRKMGIAAPPGASAGRDALAGAVPEARAKAGPTAGSGGSLAGDGAPADVRKIRALVWFMGCISLAIIAVIATARLPGLSNLAFPLMAVLFLAGGFGGGAFAGLKAGALFRGFGKGALGMIPGIVLVLMAYSVKHIIVTGEIMDTLLQNASELIRRAPPLAAAFLVYASTLAMNFFIGSASAKAMLMMPLLTPLADIVGITRQTAVLAFDFGDGFSNMVYPTNAALLIGLSFTVVGYARWIRWTWKLQAAMLLLTVAFLAFAVSIKFGPF